MSQCAFMSYCNKKLLIYTDDVDVSTELAVWGSEWTSHQHVVWQLCYPRDWPSHFTQHIKTDHHGSVLSDDWQQTSALQTLAVHRRLTLTLTSDRDVTRDPSLPDTQSRRSLSGGVSRRWWSNCVYIRHSWPWWWTWPNYFQDKLEWKCVRKIDERRACRPFMQPPSIQNDVLVCFYSREAD